MNDRLGDVPMWAIESDDEEEENAAAPPPGKSSGGDIEMGKVEEQPSHMSHFFNEIDSVKADIEFIKRATAKITKLSEEAIHATTTEKEQALSKKLKPIVTETNKRAKRTKNLIGLLKEETKNLKTEGNLKPSDERIRENLCNTLTRKFIDEMKDYQKAQQDYKTDIQKKMKRQVQIVKPDATDQEVDQIMKSEGGRDALYKEQILAGGVSDQIKTTYAKVAGKYQDVLTLEQSVAELHQMFLDFALLTEQQGELLDQIEFSVKNAADHVEDANVDVYEATEYQKKTRKKQCLIILIVVVLLIVVLFATNILP
mmetsp:Transcript_14648/g.26544  ORF Transcript_14648/g.26544 Transcript_14648/m.26544 type:complete len:313 (-) Transcript_14648:56-994(-)